MSNLGLREILHNDYSEDEYVDLAENIKTQMIICEFSKLFKSIYLSLF